MRNLLRIEKPREKNTIKGGESLKASEKRRMRGEREEKEKKKMLEERKQKLEWSIETPS